MGRVVVVLPEVGKYALILSSHFSNEHFWVQMAMTHIYNELHVPSCFSERTIGSWLVLSTVKS